MKKQIANIDMSKKKQVLHRIPEKVSYLMQDVDLHPIQKELIEDISRLYTVLKNVPNLDENIQKRILFALEYFVKSDDEIPDTVPTVGYLDDAVLVRWIAEQILEEYSHIFEA